MEMSSMDNLLEIDNCVGRNDNAASLSLSSSTEEDSYDTMTSSDSDDSSTAADKVDTSMEPTVGVSNCQAVIDFQQALKDVKKNPYTYNNYVRLCNLSHQIGDLERIRQAYTSFSIIYPLIPKFWKRYIDAELRANDSSTDYNQIETLYRKALNDYYSLELAKDFVSRAEVYKNPTNIWDEILGVYGLHFIEGSTFYDLYRKFIQNRKDELSLEEQIQLRFKSYLNQLRYPLYQMEEVYIECKVFFEKNKESLLQLVDWQEFDQEYFAAKAKLKIVTSFEQKLDSLNKDAYRERLDVYFKYLEAADGLLDARVIATIYERMVADCCLYSECWIKYIDFAFLLNKHENETDGDPLAICQKSANYISKRALRNCCWSPELYTKRIHLLDKLNSSREEIQEVIEQAVSAGFDKPEHIVDIWLEYLTYLRRKTNFNDENDCEILRKNFNLAWTTLGQQWGALADCNCEILQFWGRLEYGPLQNPKKGRELWNTVMESSDNSTKSALWMEFCMLEKQHDLEATKKLFSKAIGSRDLDNLDVLISCWKGFERTCGTIKSLEKCIHECQLASYHLSEKSAVKSTKATKRKQSPLPQHSQSKLHKTTQNVKTEDDSAKDINFDKDNIRIFLSNMDYNITEEDVRKGLSELQIVSVELIRTANGRNRGFGYVELINEAEVKKALALDRKMLNGRPLYISSILRHREQRQAFKYSTGLEPNKLFVKNLPDDCTKNDLEDIFKAYGLLKDIRLVYHKSGKFKNMAFVEYENECSAGKAVLATNKLNMKNHTLSVEISAPPRKPVLPTNVLIQKRPQKIFEQKPKITLIPSVVKTKMAMKEMPSNSNATPCPKKTNADFRKMLTSNV